MFKIYIDRNCCLAYAVLALHSVYHSANKERTIKDICRIFNVNDKWMDTGEGNMFLPAISEEADYVSELLESVDNPLYDLIKAIMKTYLEADERQKDAIKSFAKDLINNTKKESRD